MNSNQPFVHMPNMSPMLRDFARLSKSVVSAAKDIPGLGAGIGSVTSKLGPWGAALTATAGIVVGAGAALVQLTRSVAEAGVAFSKLQFTAGGSPMDTARLSSLSSALGLDAGAMARQFADNIAHNGQAAAFGAQAGVHDYGIHDSTDKAGKLLEYTKAMLKMTDADAMRSTRATGTEGLLGLRQLSQGTQKNLMETDPKLKAQTMDPKFLKDSMEFQVGLARLGEAIQNVFVSVIKPVLPMITSAFNTFTTGLQAIAGYLNTHQNQVKAAWLLLKDSFTIIFEEFIQLAKAGRSAILGVAALVKGDLGGAGTNFDRALKEATDFSPIRRGMEAIVKDWALFNTPDEKHETAIENHTNALNEHARAMREGIFGGGARARGAVPSKWRGMNSEQWGMEAAKLGAFAM